jgi:gluconate 2-dehydrogenase gamma chain
MNRREALKRVALLLGGAVSAPVVNAVLSGYRPLPRYTPRTLSPEQNELVTTIAELIIPTTDTPGAKEAGVGQFIDLLLTEWHPAADRDRFLAGLADLETQFQLKHSKSFLQGTSPEQADFLAKLDLEAIGARRARVKEVPFFGMMKEMTLVGYYTSEIGATEELQFRPATDRYDGCIPLESVGGRAWAGIG